jgi:hypothetical protein
MALLITQLGDIHFRDATDNAVARAVQIGAAISTEQFTDVTTVVLAICGDAAFSGTESQFTIAKTFIESIENEIKRRRPDTAIARVIVPGNHDCNFSGDQEARKVMLTAIKESERPAKSICDIVLAPLSEYFAFATKLAGDANAITDSHPFYQAVDIPEGNSSLRFHLINTAWMSSLHEQPGSLHFPLTEISPPSAPAGCSFAILHHPTHWMTQPHVMRPLRDRLGQLVSVVLVNHEHVPEATEHRALFGRDGGAMKTLYVSGGVIQETNAPDLCNFNVLKVDLAAKSLQISRYELRSTDGRSFFERTATEDVGLSENELSVGPAGVSLSRNMETFLDDPGAPITHPTRDPRCPVRLRDIFLYPDLWELDSDHEGRDQKQIKSQNVCAEVLSTGKLLITGGEKSGRTAIVKSLYLAAFESGKVPLFLKGGDIPKSTALLRRRIREAVSEQYSNLAPDAFEQLEQSDRVVLVDDIHRLAPAASARQQLLEELSSLFGTVILCGDNLIKLDEINGRDAKNSGLWEYRHLVIVGFGEYLREQFVRQWLMLGGDTAPDDDVLDAEVERICSLLNVVIKKQLLPAYPLFLLVILQQADLANASVQNGSFGKLFEGLITAILHKSQFGRINIGDKYHYLAALSRRMFDEQAMYLPLETARLWHRQYWDDIELEIDFDRLTSDLEMLGVLTLTKSDVRFKYAYFFCFFVAYHMNRSLHESGTRELIAYLSNHLHHRVSADIVLFLAHLTGDPFVLDEMVKTCDRLFAEVVPATLDEDVKSLNRLSDVLGTISIPDAPDENRREMKLQKDAMVAERLAATKSTHDVIPPEADSDAVKRLFDLHAAYKTIQILGQALRNIAGSASKNRKEEVIDKIIGLSRRVLGVYFQMFSDDVLPHIIDDIAEAHMEQQPELVASEIRDQVCQHLVGLSQFVCFTLIKHTTFSVGSENLAPTIHRVLRGNSDTIVRLLDLSFDLERPGQFPRDAALKLFKDLTKNRFSGSVVRILMAHHMYQYVVPVPDRQAICEKMDIKLLPSVMDRKRKRLI